MADTPKFFFDPNNPDLQEADEPRGKRYRALFPVGSAVRKVYFDSFREALELRILLQGREAALSYRHLPKYPWESSNPLRPLRSSDLVIYNEEDYSECNTLGYFTLKGALSFLNQHFDNRPSGEDVGDVDTVCLKVDGSAHVLRVIPSYQETP